MTAGLALFTPPLLWAAHFLIVYTFVSLACLWRWHHAALFGLPLVGTVVAVVTILFMAAVLLCGLASARRNDFYGRAGLGIALLFVASTAMVGLPTVLASTCR